MSPDEQKRRVAELLEFAASIKVPKEEDDGSGTAIHRGTLNLIPFKPGQSGNPGGRTVEYHECQAMAREASPKATERLIHIMRHSRDQRYLSDSLFPDADRSGASVGQNRNNFPADSPAVSGTFWLAGAFAVVD